MEHLQTATRSVPGPRPVPLIGRLGNVIRFGLDPLGTLTDLFQRYGSVVALVQGGGTRLIAPFADCAGTVFVNRADLNREIATQPELWRKSALVPFAAGMSARQRTAWQLGTGLFNLNGAAHRQHRRMLLPAFHKKQIESYRDDMVALTSRMLDTWHLGERRDIHRDMQLLSLYIAGKTLFGEDTERDPDSIGHTLRQVIDKVAHPAMAFTSYDLPGLPYRRMLDLAVHADKRIRHLIAAKRGKNHSDALSMLLAAQDAEGHSLTEDEIVGHVGALFMAGHETTATALTWTLLLVSQHPQVAASLQEELTAVLKGEAPQLASLGQLQVLDRVIKESLRLMPPTPLNHRILETQTSLGGYTIPPRTELFVSIYHIHHDPAIFPQPQRFRPERWLPAEHRPPGPFEYNPFGIGPRMCIGAPFALLELKLVLAMILQRYRLEAIPGSTIDRHVMITIAPRSGLPMIVRCQDGHFHRGVGGLRGNIRECMELPA